MQKLQSSLLEEKVNFMEVRMITIIILLTVTEKVTEPGYKGKGESYRIYLPWCTSAVLLFAEVTEQSTKEKGKI